VVACSRRHKDRRKFFRWQDSQADLVRIDLLPGRITARILPIDRTAKDLDGFRPSEDEERCAGSPAYGYATQPNHGVNVVGNRLYATNLLFGAPIEIDIAGWAPRRLLRVVEPCEDAPRVLGTAHFARSLDGRRVYFQQSLLRREREGWPAARADALRLVELDVASGAERTWDLLPPPGDAGMESANFHSAFYFEEGGRRFVGLIRTGAVVAHVAPHVEVHDHEVVPMPASSIWIVEIDPERRELRAEELPGIAELGGLALSHLDVDASGGDGFVLYANFKEAAVGEESHGPNVYGEAPHAVFEHYEGMTVEPMRHGTVIRYERRGGRHHMTTLSRAYDPARTSAGHTWLPINLEIDARSGCLFASFAGFRPRQLSRHIAAAYPGRAVDPRTVRYIPPLVMRLDAETLTPDTGNGAALSYAESIAMALATAGDGETYLCTFSPEAGLRIYRAGDLDDMVCHAVAPELMCWQDTHFRPDPAHLAFVAR
jgi:hypothetical protein